MRQQLTEEEQKIIYDIIHSVELKIQEMNPKIQLAMSALCMVCIRNALRFDISKPKLLNYISEVYEMNDKNSDEDFDEDETDFDEECGEW